MSLSIFSKKLWNIPRKWLNLVQRGKSITNFIRIKTRKQGKSKLKIYVEFVTYFKFDLSKRLESIFFSTFFSGGLWEKNFFLQKRPVCFILLGENVFFCFPPSTPKNLEPQLFLSANKQVKIDQNIFCCEGVFSLKKNQQNTK